MKYCASVAAMLLAAAPISAAASEAAAVAAAVAAVAAPETKEQAAGFYRIQLGDFLITAITDGAALAPYGELLRGMTPPELEAAFARQGQKSDRLTSINMFLIDTGEKRILVDAGAGSIYGDCCGQLPKQLAAAGYTPESVDAVLLTHVHADHSFGLIQNGQRFFPNADIYLGKGELDYWLSESRKKAAKDSHKSMFTAGQAALAPYIAAGRIKPIEKATEIFAGVRAVPSPGHTPGHSFYDIESKGARMRVIGDMIHAAEVQLPMPHITIDFDENEPAAAALRQAALKEISEAGMLVAAPHINFPGLGHIVRAGDGYGWAPLAYSAAFRYSRDRVGAEIE